MEAIKDDRMYNTNEIIAIVNVSKPTILKDMKNGELPFEGHGGRGGFRVLGCYVKEYAKKRGYRPSFMERLDAQEKDTVTNKKQLKVIELELKELEIMLSIAKAQYQMSKSTEDYIAMKKAELAIVTYKLQLEKGTL